MPRDEPEETNLGPVAEQAEHCLDICNGDVSKATELMRQRINEDRDLFNELVEPLVKAACYTAVAARIRARREHVWVAPRYDGLDSLSAVTQRDRDRLSSLASRNLLNFPLPGGQLLGDASKTAILEASSVYRTQSAATAHKARWLERVAGEVPEGKIARTVLSEKELRQFQEETK